MFFKVYSVQTLSEATSFVQDLKLGHYIGSRLVRPSLVRYLRVLVRMLDTNPVLSTIGIDNCCGVRTVHCQGVAF